MKKPNRNRVILNTNGDKYHIQGSTVEGFNIRLWNAQFQAWVDNFNPSFLTLKAAKNYINERTR